MNGETVTARFALIGDPVDHSFSPVMQMAAFRASRIAATYVALRVCAADLADTLARCRSERWAGFNATTPLKEALLPYMDELTPEAKAAGGVNVVRLADARLIGHNTDGAGMLDALHESGCGELRGARALVLGAGPAARAIGAALADAGAIVECWARVEERAQRVGAPPSGDASIIISALPADAFVPAEVVAHIARGALIADANYNASRSPLAPQEFARHIDGIGMLLHQGARSFTWWTRKSAPIDAMRAALAHEIDKGRAATLGAESKPR